MSELSFLLELLLNHKLRRETKDAIQERIKGLDAPRANPYAALGHNLPAPAMPVHTPAAVQALADRANAIQQAMSGKAEPGATSPRKFRGAAS